MNMMSCVAIGELNKQAKDIILAMQQDWQLNFEDAAERLGIEVTPKLVEIYNANLASAYERLTVDGETPEKRRTFEKMLATPIS